MKAPVSLTSFRPQNLLLSPLACLPWLCCHFSITPLMKVNAAFCCATEKIVKLPSRGWVLRSLYGKRRKISTRNQAVVYQGLQAYSRDQQPAQMTVSVSFHIKPSEAGAVYTTYNTIEALKIV